ncbi:competence protein ComEA [Oerskovia sp. Root918]|nr:competence protein ComEA [Oerskovia sp. Root22]KRD36991.1 competence protein ComEA [Oerskovia sp. Root918]
MHVVGAVGAPGLVTVPEGSRVADALAAAGDATAEADLAGVNLAREVVDGEQIVVPRPGEVVAAAPGPATAPGSEAGPVDLNSADQTALDALSGIGPVLAARIVEWREANGRFTSVEELGEVSGIGDALLARLRDQVRV